MLCVFTFCPLLVIKKAFGMKKILSQSHTAFELKGKKLFRE